MRAHLLAVIGLTLMTAFILLACAGTQPPSQSPSSAGSAEPLFTPDASDAALGPTTTTTVSLRDGGDLQGAKLTTVTTSTTETKGDAGSRAEPSRGPEPGRRKEDIQSIVVARRDAARACYDKAVKAHPGIEGDLDIMWTIDPKGNVTSISVDDAKSQIHDKAVSDCIIEIIRGIKFSESPKGFETRAHYPFNFHPHAAR